MIHDINDSYVACHYALVNPERRVHLQLCHQQAAVRVFHPCLAEMLMYHRGNHMYTVWMLSETF